MKVIQENLDPTSNLFFDLINIKRKIIKNLDTCKATQHDDIPTKIMKDDNELFLIFYFFKTYLDRIIP